MIRQNLKKTIDIKSSMFAPVHKVFFNSYLHLLFNYCVMESITVPEVNRHIHSHTLTHTLSHREVELQQCGAGEEATGPWPHNHLLESDHQGLQHHCTNTPTLEPWKERQGRGVDGGFRAGKEKWSQKRKKVEEEIEKQKAHKEFKEAERESVSSVSLKQTIAKQKLYLSVQG